MATLGVVYDADPAPRRPHDVMTPAITLHASDGGGRQRRQGPAATAKWLTGSIATSSQQVIAAVFDQAQQRDPTHRRPWVVLVDGARHQLDLIRAEAARRGVAIHILVDFIHALEYVWRAAWCFYQDAVPAAEPWVAGHALRILAGEADTVIAALGQQATDADLTPHQRGGVDTCIGYLRAKRDLLGYDTALARGWPIATGVIEGACRHLIGDRLDITGARWGLQGAEAVLKLRALWTNGDFPAYWRHHLAQEHRRVHQARYQQLADAVAALWSAGTGLALQPAAVALDDTHARVILAEPSPPDALEEPSEAVLSRLDRPFGRRACDLAAVLDASARQLLGRPLTRVHAHDQREQGRIVVELSLAQA